MSDMRPLNTLKNTITAPAPAPAGASGTRPTRSAPRRSERAPNGRAAAPAASAAPWAAGPGTVAAARDSWEPPSRRGSAAAPEDPGFHLHPGQMLRDVLTIFLGEIFFLTTFWDFRKLLKHRCERMLELELREIFFVWMEKQTEV